MGSETVERSAKTLPNGGGVHETEPLENGDVAEKQQPPCSDFDDILTVIGSEGRYQMFLMYGFLSALITIAPLLELNLVFLFDVPDHWCRVPGNVYEDIEEWKNLTIPKELSPEGTLRFSHCKMYSLDDPLGNHTVPCQFGWEFDKKDYESTIPSAFGWVCGNSNYVADVISLGSVGAAIGTFFYGLLADRIGRRPVFLITCTMVIICRTIGMLLTEHIIMFKLLWLLSFTSFTSLYTIPSLALAEVCGPDYRSRVYAILWIVWVFGNCLLPVLTWLAREWWLIAILTTAPALLMFLFCPFLLESPRWLITAGKRTDAVQTILKIANYNRKKIDESQIEKMVDVLMEKQRLENQKNKRIGVWSLFQKPTIAKNTILLCIAWSMNGLLYYGITLHTTSLEGNKFFNYFVMSLIEIPSGYFGGILVEKTGRRWTQVGFFFTSLLSCIICGAFVGNSDMPWIVIFGALGIKFAVSISFLVAYLQGTEIFPTLLRSTGNALAATLSVGIGFAGPYIVATSHWNASFPYIFLACISIIGLISAAFLPETLHQHLPETLEDADNFGKNSKFWSYLPNKKKEGESDDVTKAPLTGNNQ